MRSIIAATFPGLRTVPALAASDRGAQQGTSGGLRIALCSGAPLNFLMPSRVGDQFRGCLQRLLFLLLAICLMFPVSAFCEESDWSLGGYAGQYYDSEPAGLTQGRANFLNQYMVALTASKTVWRSSELPLSLEIDGMIGQQFGLEAVSEIAVAPVLRWSSFPWKEILQTDFRFGPVGISHTSKISSLEQDINGNGSRTLNFLLIEFAFSLPQKKSKEVFVRLHHRCTIYDLLNSYGANGEDFLAFGFRHRF